MANIEELRNQACEVRDADQEKENTALRVGGLLVAVIEALSTLNSEQTAAIENALSRYFTDGELNYSALPVRLLEALRDIDDKYASKDASSLLLPIHSRSLLLDSMGRNLDGVDYSPQTGDLVWERGFVWTYNGTDYDQGGVPPSRHVVYINKHTGKHYLWNGSQMVESTGGDGISEDDIVANLNSGDNHKALAASMGSVLKQAITTILNSLSNSAFSTGRPTIVWVVPQTYRITYGTMSHCTGGSATEVTENNPFNVTLVPDNGYTFTANGASVIITMGGVDVTNAYFNKQTGALSIPSVTGNVVISATAAMPVRFTIQATTSHATFDGLTSVGEGESWSGTLTPASGYSLRGEGASIVVNMAGGGTHTITYNNGVATINIPAVTGNVTINATAVVTSNHTISFDLTGCTATGNTTIEDGESATITLKKGSNWSSVASSDGSEYQVPFNKRDILVMNASDNVSLIEGTDYTISQSALDSDIVLTFPSVFANIRIMNIVWGANGIKVVNGEESTGGGSRYAHIETYIPIPTNCRALSIMTNIVSSGNAGVALYNNGKTFASGQNATALEVVNLSWDASEQANHAFLRSSIYSWYKSQKEEEGYYGTIPPGEPVSGNNFEKVVAWCYIYDKTNGRFIWKGEEAATSYVFEHQTLGQ